MRAIQRRIGAWHVASGVAIASIVLSLSAAASGNSEDPQSKGKGKAAGKHADGKGSREEKASSDTKHVSEEERLAAIHRAQVWTATDIPNMDLRAGPKGAGGFAPNELVTCDYTPTKRKGASPKFDCAIDEGEVVKVKFGTGGEVEAEVAATRLLWALGFAADRMYPVRVNCRGCSSDPWANAHKTDETHVFDPASIERKLPGHALESDKMQGWAWRELVLTNPAEGGATQAQREALTLVAVLIQHSDNKPENQRLLCPPGGSSDRGCANPIMMLNDLGQTFGRANVFNRDKVSGLSFDGWSKTSVWRDESGCVARLARSNTGTLEDPPITEAGRAFLAGLLVQLTDRQLHDLFDVARVQLRSRKPGSSEPPASVDEWVTAFKHKREEIVNRRCGA